jgi:hypothetical protein
MPFCCSRSFLALLLVAGVSGGFSTYAPAGQKIEFSSLDSEALATPTVESAVGESEDIFSAFLSYNNRVPGAGDIYPLFPAAEEAPARLGEDRNSLNGNGGLGSELDRSGQNGGLGNSPWETSATNYAYKPASNSVDELGAWGETGIPNGLGRGMDNLVSRYGLADAGLESALLLERRNRQSGFDAGNSGTKAWASRKEDGYDTGAKTPIADLLRQQSRSLPGAGYGLFKPVTQLFGSKAPMLSSDSSMISPLDAGETGYNAYNGSSASDLSLSSGKNSGKQDAGNASGISGMRAWGDELGASLQAADPAPARKPPVPPAQAGAQRQQGGATLPWPKRPGSTFN